MPPEASAATNAGILPFDLRADDKRMHLYLDRAAGVPLGNVTLQTVMAELDQKRCVRGPETADEIRRTLVTNTDLEALQIGEPGNVRFTEHDLRTRGPDAQELGVDLALKPRVNHLEPGVGVDFSGIK